MSVDEKCSEWLDKSLTEPSEPQIPPIFGSIQEKRKRKSSLSGPKKRIKLDSEVPSSSKQSPITPRLLQKTPNNPSKPQISPKTLSPADIHSLTTKQILTPNRQKSKAKKVATTCNLAKALPISAQKFEEPVLKPVFSSIDFDEEDEAEKSPTIFKQDSLNSEGLAAIYFDESSSAALQEAEKRFGLLRSTSSKRD